MNKITTIATSPHGSGRVTFSPNKRFFANAGLAGGTVSLWDSATGSLVRKLDHITDATSTLDFSPDGALLATGGNETGVRLWNTESWENCAIIEEKTGHIQRLLFSMDGKMIARGRASDMTTCVWNIKTGELVTSLEFHPFVFHPLKPVLVLSKENELSYFDYSAKTLVDIELKGLSGLNISFSPNGRLIAWESHEGKIYIWDTTTMQVDKVITYLQDTGEHPTFSPDGKILAVAYSDSGCVILWDVETGNLIDKTLLSFERLNNFAFSPDEKILVAGGGGRWGGGIDMWQIPDMT